MQKSLQKPIYKCCKYESSTLHKCLWVSAMFNIFVSNTRLGFGCTFVLVESISLVLSGLIDSLQAIFFDHSRSLNNLKLFSVVDMCLDECIMLLPSANSLGTQFRLSAISLIYRITSLLSVTLWKNYDQCTPHRESRCAIKNYICN